MEVLIRLDFDAAFHGYVIAGIGLVEKGHRTNDHETLMRGKRLLEEGRDFHINRTKDCELLFYGLALAESYLENVQQASDYASLINGELAGKKDIGEVRTFLGVRF